MAVNLILSSNSVRNTTVSCDSLGIHYEVSENDGVVTINRWDSTSNKNVFVAEFELHKLHKDKVRMGEGGDWRELDEVLPKEGGMISHDRTFTGNDGKQYRWGTKLGKVYMYEGANKDTPLITYHHERIGKKDSYLELSDPSLTGSLDNVIVTFLIFEKKHRDRQKRQGAAGGAGGGGAT